MTGLDQLLRDTLRAAAETHQPAADLAARSVAAGRRNRRRRRTIAGIAVVASVISVVAGVVAATDSGQRPARQVVSTAGQGDRDGPSVGAGRPKPGARSSQAWTSWPAHRVFGSDPGPGFFRPSAHETVFAIGTMSDHTNFVVYGDRQDGHSAQFLQGWYGHGNFGESAGEAPGGAQARYLTAETPTYQAGRVGKGGGQWLIVVGRPGTSAASYSADGSNWQPMAVENGIAVLRLPGFAPRTAMIRLSDSSGRYYGGTLVSP